MSAMLPEMPTGTRTDMYFGDVRDDDAEYYKELGRNVDPDAHVAAPVKVAEDTYIPAKPTRILTGTIEVDPAWTEPTMLLPRDQFRKSLTIAVAASDEEDYICLSSERQDLISAPSAGRVYPCAPTEMLCGHTGALWVTAANILNKIVVSYWVVTE